MAKKKKEIASVLAFEKKLVPSDGYMYGTVWEKKDDSSIGLKLIEKSVRGTISNRLNKAMQKDPAKLDAEVEKPNLQTVDSCSLGQDQDTLKLTFTLKVLKGVETPSACNSSVFQTSYAKAAQQYIEEDGFKELAKRYATNIANGRFLWRNRVGAEKIEVIIKILNGNTDKKWIFDATTFSVQDFDDSNPEIDDLATFIADALSGNVDFLMLEVTAFAQTGSAQEVYPSEELVMDKSNAKTKKSKILYAVDGIAAMHSQKIGNAIRTIDTWYPEFGETDIAVGPIAIEPYGAVTNLGKAYRTPKNKADFYTLFDKFAKGDTLDSKEQEHYVMATLVRGGVFGESDK